MHADVAQDPLDRVVAQIAIAAMQLQAAVHHLETGVGREPLGLPASRVAWPSPALTATGGAMQQQARGFESVA